MKRTSLSREICPQLRLLALGVCLLIAHTSLAQNPDSLTHHYDSLAKIKLSLLDSSKNRLNNKIDSVQLRLNNILNPDVTKLTSKIQTRKPEQPDSLRAVQELGDLKRGLTHKIDSLKQLNLPTDRYTRKLDSLNNISPRKYIDMANAKVTSVEGTINKPIDQVENKINDKLDVMRQEGGDKANLPANLDTKIPSLDKTSLPDTNLNTKVDIDKTIDNPLDKVDNPVTDQAGQLNELKAKANEVKSAPQQQLEKIKSVEEIQSAREKVADLNKTTDEIQSYQGDVNNIAQGDLDEVKDVPQAIEKKASNLDEIKELQKQTGEIDKAKGLVDKGKDPGAVKEMAKQEISKQAIDHFKGKEQVLQEAMDKVSKLKAKYPELTSLKYVPKRMRNPMKGKPFIERIVPGVTLQFQKMNNFTVDINPVVSYRFTGRINAGLGWNERLSFARWNKLAAADRIYGPRVFGSFGFKKGFSIKAEVEKMNTLIPPSAVTTDGSRQWIWSAFVGIKKDYKFIGSVRGNAQILYNIYDDHDNSPYFDRFNVRMGFEFPMKKQKRPPGK